MILGGPPRKKLKKVKAWAATPIGSDSGGDDDQLVCKVDSCKAPFAELFCDHADCRAYYCLDCFDEKHIEIERSTGKIHRFRILLGVASDWQGRLKAGWAETSSTPQADLEEERKKTAKKEAKKMAKKLRKEEKREKKKKKKKDKSKKKQKGERSKEISSARAASDSNGSDESDGWNFRADPWLAAQGQKELAAQQEADTKEKGLTRDTYRQVLAQELQVVSAREMARFVVVSGLPQTASRKEVTEYFRPCGKIAEVEIANAGKHRNSLHQGVARIEFDSTKGATKAMVLARSGGFQGNPITVAYDSSRCQSSIGSKRKALDEKALDGGHAWEEDIDQNISELHCLV